MYDEFVKCGSWIMFGDYVGRVVWREDGTRTTQLHHRFIIENAHGRRLRSDEHVHHINGITTDNRIENLEVLTAAAHAAEHGLVRTADSLSEFTCATCGTGFFRRTAIVNYEKARGKKKAGLFCSRQCAGNGPRAGSGGTGNKKLTTDEVSRIEQMLLSGRSIRSTGKELSLDRETIRKIARGEYWLPVRDQAGSRKRRPAVVTQ